MDDSNNYITSYDIQSERNLPEKMTAIKNIAISYNLLLRGYEINPASNKFEITGPALIGSQFIRQTSNILHSFCEYANLISTKDEDKFFREYADAFYRVNAMLVTDPTRTKHTYRAIIKIFKDRLSSIGDIITGSRELTKGIFENEKLLQDDSGDV